MADNKSCLSCKYVTEEGLCYDSQWCPDRVTMTSGDYWCENYEVQPEELYPIEEDNYYG